MEDPSAARHRAIEFDACVRRPHRGCANPAGRSTPASGRALTELSFGKIKRKGARYHQMPQPASIEGEVLLRQKNTIPSQRRSSQPEMQPAFVSINWANSDQVPRPVVARFRCGLSTNLWRDRGPGWTDRSKDYGSAGSFYFYLNLAFTQFSHGLALVRSNYSVDLRGDFIARGLVVI